MKIIKIVGTAERPRYTPSVFYVPDSGPICCENKELGFFVHPNIQTREALRNHIAHMRAEGFDVIEETYDPFRAVPYNRLRSFFCDYVANDADASSTEYVLDMLQMVGCSKDEAEEIGLGWVYDVAEDE